MFNTFNKCMFIVILQTYVYAEEVFYNQIVHTESYRNLIIESDESDINKITNINYDLIEKTFIIDYFEKATILQIIMLNSIHFQTELAFCICQLFKSNNEQYFISCIDGIHIDYKNHKTNQLENAKKYNISLSQPHSQECNDMYASDLNKINIVCHTKEKLIIYSIDLQKQNSLIISQNLNHSKEGCLRKIMPFENSELIVFHNCEVWEVFEMNSQNLTLLFDKTILEKLNFELEINLLTEIEGCQNNIFLIEKNEYKQWQKQNQKINWQKVIMTTQPIVKIIFNSLCNVEGIVTKSQNGDQIQFIKESSIIQIRDDENDTEIFHTKQYLVLKKKSQVKVIITSFLEQNHQLLSGRLKFHFIKQQENFIMKYMPELYYQINSLTNQIQFYKFLKFKQYLKISKKYIFDFKTINLFTEPDNHFFARILIKDQNYYENNIKNQLHQINLINNCQNIDQFQVSKDFYGLPINHKLLIIHDKNNFFYDITDEIDFDELCPHFNFQIVSQIVTVRIDYKILIFIVDNILQVVNCKTQQIYCMINIQNKQVFENLGNIYLFEVKQKYYQLLFFYEEQCIINTFQFDVKQIQSNLLIKLSNQILNLNMLINQYQQMEDIYSQYEMPQFYFEKFDFFYVYQYNHILLIKKSPHRAIHLVEIDANYQIIHLQIQNKNYFFIGVHKSSNSIILYYLDEDFIVSSRHYYLDEYQIVQPLKYQVSNSNLILAATTNQGQALFLIFSLGIDFEFVDVRITGNLNSLLQVQDFFYFDKYKKLRLLNLNYYTIKLKLDLIQENFVDLFPQKLNVYLKNNQSFHIVQAQILIKFINNCYSVRPLQNSTVFKNIDNDNNQLLLNVRDYFIGPINQIILEDKILQITGPFIQKEIKIYQSKIVNISFTINLKYQQLELIQMKCLINEQENQLNFQFCNFVNNYLKVQISDYFYLAAEKLLILFIIEFLQSEIYVLSYDEVNNIFIKEYSIYLNSNKGCFTVMQNVRKYKHYFYSLLLVCESEFQYYQYTFKKENYSAFLIHENFRDIIYVENSDNYHISFNSNEHSDIYIFEIIQSPFQSVRIIKQLKIDIYYFQMLTKNYIFEPHFGVTYNSIQCFQSSHNVNNTLLTIFFLYTQRLSFEIEFSYNLKNDEYDFKINKIFRNPFPFSNVNVQYYDEQILILRETNYYNNFNNFEYYLYDLRQSHLMYDYIYRFQNYEFKLLRLNNTVYFVQQNDNENFIFLEIGYFLEMKNKTQEKIEIRALNQISNSTIELILLKKHENDDDKQSKDIKMITYLLIILVLLILVFLIRRKKKINQYIQNQDSIDQKI